MDIMHKQTLDALNLSQLLQGERIFTWGEVKGLN